MKTSKSETPPRPDGDRAALRIRRISAAFADACDSLETGNLTGNFKKSP
jgi:hypothetical protein